MARDEHDGREADGATTRSGEGGEGVISAAIAVLVMAFLGVAMWGAFNVIFDDAQQQVHDNVRQIGE